MLATNITGAVSLINENMVELFGMLIFSITGISIQAASIWMVVKVGFWLRTGVDSDFFGFTEQQEANAEEQESPLKARLDKDESNGRISDADYYYDYDEYED